MTDEERELIYKFIKKAVREVLTEMEEEARLKLVDQLESYSALQKESKKSTWKKRLYRLIIMYYGDNQKKYVIENQALMKTSYCLFEKVPILALFCWFKILNYPRVLIFRQI